MTTPDSTLDHQLPAARRQLSDAVHHLAGRQRLTVDRDPSVDILADLDADYQRRRATILAQPGDHTAVLADLQRRHEEAVTAATTSTSWTPSRYEQLDAALTRPRLGRGGHTDTPHPPIWVDGVDLRAKIITHVREWAISWQTPCLAPVAVLHALADRAWRPQDVPAILTIAGRCEDWAKEIDQLFDPPRRLTISAACPECGESTVYRPDETGEWVRQPALTVDYQRGADCLACREHWPPERFLLLEAVIRQAAGESA
ncbi:hypothetical protein MYK68_15965 [Gordonia sp. PP30]|uniref:DUF7341 domain-containing protein n=1 Tax=Gordonia sp. PP30 TaxID=2935861 RepID=UPI001FFE65BD|nr:hypothetical protein [Gordonia sp. PP30]UQE74207.1 hypothetical protein MYK68_15965 [Gordonia sp. PP30]